MHCHVAQPLCHKISLQGKVFFVPELAVALFFPSKRLESSRLAHCCKNNRRTHPSGDLIKLSILKKNSLDPR
jgi:hypothetical protein